MATQIHGARTSVSLATMKSITGTLASILKSVGPRCRQALLCTATGQVLATSDGATILHSLMVSHPLARLVTGSVKKHCTASGDGAKTFVWYLSGALTTVEELALKDSVCSEKTDLSQKSLSTFCNQMSTSLKRLTQELLPSLLQQVEKKAIVLHSDVNTEVLRDHLEKVLVGVLSPHFSPANADFLQGLLVKTLCGDSDRQASLRSVLSKTVDLIDHFSSVTLKVCNHSFTASQLLPGFLIQRDFALLQPGLCSASDVRFVMLQCTIEGKVEEEASEIIKLSSPDMARKALAARIQSAGRFLQQLKKAGVSLILCAQKIPEYVLALCQAEGLSAVSFMEEEDMAYLELVSRKFSMHSSLDPVEDSYIGMAACVQRLIIGGKGYVQLELKESTVPLTHLLLCAPTEGMGQHLSVMVMKALMSVRMCFVDQSVPRKETSPSDLECLSPPCGDSKPLHRERNKSATWNDHMSSGNEYGVVENSPKSTSEDCIDSDPNSAPCGLFPTSCSSLKVLWNCPSVGQQDLAFCAIRGGGYFEFLLAELLREHSQDFRHEALGLASRVLHDGLLSLPRQMCRCLQHSHSSQDRGFLEELTRVQDALRSGQQCSLNQFGKVVVSPGCKRGDSVSPPVLDPLAIKINTVLSVVQLLQQMLRIDSILGVRKIPQAER